MSVKYLGAHRVRAGETAASLARRFHLSSSLAITGIPANKNIGALPGSLKELPEGTVIAIPPNAAELTKERLYSLHAARPSFLDHFDQLLSLSESGLKLAVFGAESPFDSESVKTAIGKLDSFVANEVRKIAGRAEPLVAVCRGMAHTHVAQWSDHAAVEAVADPLCSLYWAISPAMLDAWTGMWAEDVFAAQWLDKDAETAWRLACQHQTTVRSLVVQQIDQRIRDAQALERQLRRETDAE